MSTNIPIQPVANTLAVSCPHEIAASIGYQAGAVVSREVLRKKAGTVTLFAFDTGQGLSEHTAPFDALVHVLDGEAEITIDGNPQRVTAGQIIIMPAQIPHSLQAVQRFKMMLVMIRGE
jgi:quercetin dioxygenase-like cupin family protein